MDTGLPADLEEICEIIDRLELHRRCLDEALADAYAELVAMLGCGAQAPRPVMTS